MVGLTLVIPTVFCSLLLVVLSKPSRPFVYFFFYIAGITAIILISYFLVLFYKGQTEKAVRFIQVVATVYTIGAIVLGVYQFIDEIDRERLIEQKTHLSRINALSIELKRNIQLAQSFVEGIEYFPKKRGIPLFFSEFLIDNLQVVISDGNLQNQELRESISKLSVELRSTNNLIRFLNDPDVFININNSEIRRNRELRVTYLRVELTGLIEYMNGTKAWLDVYSNCLQKPQTSIKDCNELLSEIIQTPTA